MLTPFVQTLLVVNVLMFLLQQSLDPVTLFLFGLMPGDGTGLASLPWQAPWQLITYSFLHGSVMHLLLNMMAVFMFGPPLETIWGTRRFVLTWFLSVLTAALTHLLIGTALGGAGGPLIGASGGVFGLLLAYAMLFPNNRIMLLIPPIPLPARVFVALYAVIELVLGVTGTLQGVAHFAHLGGLIGGWIGWRHGHAWRNRRR